MGRGGGHPAVVNEKKMVKFCEDASCTSRSWLETRARPSHPPIGRFLLVKYKPRAGAWCNELNQKEGLILAFIVCVSSVNGGMAPGEMEIIFATEYGFRMCSPFRLGSRDERRSSQKFSFPNPTAKTSHLGPRRVRRTELF